MLLGVFVYSVAWKEEYSKLWCVWLTTMLFGYNSKFFVDFFKRSVICFKILIKNVTIVFTKVLNIKELAHLDCLWPILLHCLKVGIKLFNLSWFLIDRPYCWVILLCENQCSFYLRNEPDVTDLVLNCSSSHFDIFLLTYFL